MIELSNRPTRAKRVVVVQLKDKKPEPFRTCPEIYLKYDKEKIGICLNALWNALAKDGCYENKTCKISYQNIEQLKTSAWEQVITGVVY